MKAIAAGLILLFTTAAALADPQGVPCRYMTLTPVIYPAASNYSGEGTIRCYDEYTNPYTGEFTGSVSMADLNTGTTVSQASCTPAPNHEPLCYAQSWTGTVGGIATASHCYRVNVSGTSTFYSNTVGSGQSCAPAPPSGGGGDPGGTQNGDPNSCDPFGDPTCSSPIVVNLGLGAYQLSSVDDPVLFDLNADGALERIAWTAGGEPMAFLAYDRNGNGIIDDGSELFGNHTPLRSGASAANGFVALAEFDSNGDGVIDARDDAWPHLLLWTDWNHDGVSQSDEIQPLSGSGVTSLELRYHWTGRRDPSGNILRFEALMHFAGGRRPYYDVYLRAAP